MKKGRRIKNDLGITLIALVVTIVILLILAGVTIASFTGDNGVLNETKGVQNKIQDLQNQTMDDLQQIANDLSSSVGGALEPSDPTNPPEENLNPTIEEIVGKIQETTKVLEDANGNKVVIPGGFKIVPDTDENNVDYSYLGKTKPCVQDGIVIEDREGNQFVWIPVGDIKSKNNIITTITLGRYSFDATNGTPTLQQNADNYTQTVTIDSYYQELENSSSNTSAKDLEDFVIKTKVNGGYYLGRYEASQGLDKKVKSQYDKIPWVSIAQPEAATAAREMYGGNNYVESDLVNSYSWDTAIVFIQKYSGNSNYANKRGIEFGKEKLNTGKSGDKVCNIQDMAANCYEWTTEHSTLVDTFRYPCVTVGGICSGNGASTAKRGSVMLNGGYDLRTFRPLCYLK